MSIKITSKLNKSRGKMKSNIIDGKLISEQYNKETAVMIAEIKNKYNTQPGLAVVLIGDNPASEVYVNMKSKRSAELGIYSVKKVLDKNTSQKDVLTVIEELNNDKRINGILVQSPPPSHIDESAIIAAIRPEKDVDCFHSQNVGKMLNGDEDGFMPCTPHGIMILLERSGVDPAGKHAVVIGRSNIVGKPMMALLVQKAKGANATVTVCHSRTPDIAYFTRQADIVIAAIGKPEFLKADMVKDGVVVIDVGINRIDDKNAPKGYRIVGDVDYENVSKKASLITPVPGGVGPMTIAALMRNTLKAFKLQNNIK